MRDRRSSSFPADSPSLILSPSAVVFDVEPQDLLTAVGASARFDCTFSTTSPASLSWLLDGETLGSDPRYTFHSNGSLEISAVETGDEGEYMCVVTDTVTMETEERSASLTLASENYFLSSFKLLTHTNFTITAAIAFGFLLSPDSTTINEGDSLHLFCIHGGSLPAATITWTLDGSSVELSERVTVNSVQLAGTDPLQTSSSLYISSAEPVDEGSYVCEARNELLPGTVISSSAADITIIGKL